MSAEQNKPTWADAAWLRQLEAEIFAVGKNQLNSDNDTYRLMVLALACTLVGHRYMSERGGATHALRALKKLHREIASADDGIEADPATLGEMVIVMEMASTALSAIDYRREKIGVDEAEIETPEFSRVLVQIMREACRKGGPRVAATLSRSLKGWMS